jgi:hypothetical protein
MKWVKVFGVVFGAVLVTALGIDAADTMSGSRSTLLGQLISSEVTGVCPKGMAHVPQGMTFTCVDLFEVSAATTCPHPNPQNELQTKENIESTNCEAASEEDVDAWRFITREQAVIACSRAGKRLPKSNEWYVFAVGTPDDSLRCNIDSSAVSKTGLHKQCIASTGVFDAIGNAWEWTQDDVINGQYQGRALPPEGYVTQVDSHGVATLTNSASSDLFYKDYFWSAQEGAYGILRGGFYGSKEDAGVYSVQAQTLPTAAGTAIGFRCVQ